MLGTDSTDRPVTIALPGHELAPGVLRPAVLASLGWLGGEDAGTQGGTHRERQDRGSTAPPGPAPWCSTAYCLPAAVHVDVLNSDMLIPAVAKATTDLKLGGVGPQ